MQDTLTFLINEHHQEVTRNVIGQKLNRFEIYAHVRSDHKLDLRNKMPGSRRRKRQMAANRRQLGRARRKIQREGRGKENNGSLLQDCRSNSSLENRPALTSEDEAAGVRGWWNSLYNWCHAGLTQVCSLWVCVNNCGAGPLLITCTPLPSHVIPVGWMVGFFVPSHAINFHEVNLTA